MKKSHPSSTFGSGIGRWQSVAMQKWEYFTAPILSHVAQQILNNFGSEGWELVQVAPGPNPDTMVGYFKRPVQEG